MKGDRLIRAAMMTAVSAVAAVAAWVSFFHAVAVVERYGAESATTAHLMPVCTDGLIIAGSMVLLHCARARIRAPFLARAALGLGIAATLVLNISHGLSKGGSAALIAGWPAVALVVSYELLMWLVRQTSDMVSDGLSETQPDDRKDTSDTAINVARPDTEPMSDLQEASTGNGRTRVDMGKALSLLSATPGISSDELGRELGCTARHADRIRKKLSNGSAPDERSHRDAQQDEPQEV